MSYLNRIIAWRKYFLQDCNISVGPSDLGGFYIDSTDLWGIGLDAPSERVRFKNGILHFFYPDLGIQVNPAYISWYGLISLNRWIKQRDQKFFDQARDHAKWLKDNAVSWKGAVRWEYSFKFHSSNAILNPPWASAIAQGLAISLLTRISKIVGDDDMRKVAHLAVKLYELSIEEGGIAVYLNNEIYFEEYPAYPLTLILDGTLFALLGLYDISADSLLANELFNKAIKGLDKNWKIWDWHGVWSNYGTTGYLSTVSYHRLNCALIDIFQRKGYLKKFPLSRWKSGMKIKEIAALFQMRRSFMEHTFNKKCAV